MDITQITDLATTWCRMWNEDPALAHDLMTDDCVQWSGNTPGLDAVVGPTQQEQFIAAYRAKQVNVFVPRVFVNDGDLFAYLWDVTLPDGTVKTGMDVNVLQGRRIHENWTIVGDRHKDDPDPSYGDESGRVALIGVATQWAAAHGFELHRSPVVDFTTGRIALLHTAPDSCGGISLLTLRDGAAEPIWSVTGVRPFTY